MSDTGRIKLFDAPVPAGKLGDVATQTTEPLSLGRMPEAAQYLNLQAKFTAAPAGAGYTLADVASAASAVDVTIVDTVPSIVTGTVRVVGTVGGVAGTTEDVDISAGAGVYTTTALFTAISAVYSWGVTVLAGAGDETIKVEWAISGDDIVAATNLVEPTASLKVYAQTKLDNGVTWCDIANFTFTLFDARRLHAIKLSTALAANVTPTDGTMTANTILSGLLGNKVRLKLIATGNYQPDSHLVVDMTVR
jgi:hypothetical protein